MTPGAGRARPELIPVYVFCSFFPGAMELYRSNPILFSSDIHGKIRIGFLLKLLKYSSRQLTRANRLYSAYTMR